MNIGEKIETIILSRSSGSLGEYLGSSSETFGACRIDGEVYKVRRNIEVNSPMWVVRKVSDGSEVVANERYDLSLIKDSDFKVVA